MRMIKKVPLKDLISILVELYDRGANFVDIKGASIQNQDTIQIGVCEEYMEQSSSTKFSEEDFKNLII